MQKIVYESSKEDLKGAISESIAELIHEAEFARFQGIIYNTDEACKLLRISAPTLYDYIDRGLIAANKEGKNWKFDLRDLLEFNVRLVKGKKIRVA